MSPIHITRDMVTGIRSNSIVLLRFLLVTGFSSEIMFSLSFLWLMPGLITFSESGYNKRVTQTSYFTVLLNCMFRSPQTPKFTPDVPFYCVYCVLMWWITHNSRGSLVNLDSKASELKTWGKRLQAYVLALRLGRRFYSRQLLYESDPGCSHGSGLHLAGLRQRTNQQKDFPSSDRENVTLCELTVWEW